MLGEVRHPQVDPVAHELGVLSGRVEGLGKRTECVEAGIKDIKALQMTTNSHLEKINGTVVGLVRFKEQHEVDAKQRSKEQQCQYQSTLTESRQQSQTWRNRVWNNILTLAIVLVAFVMQALANKWFGWHA